MEHITRPLPLISNQFRLFRVPQFLVRQKHIIFGWIKTRSLSLKYKKVRIVVSESETRNMSRRPSL